MQCPRCHRSVRDGAHFCTNCGAGVPAGQIEPVVSASGAWPVAEPEIGVESAESRRPTLEQAIAPLHPPLGPALAGTHRTATGDLPRAPRLSDPAIIVNPEMFQDGKMSDRIHDEHFDHDDVPELHELTERHSGTDQHPFPGNMHAAGYDDDEFDSMNEVPEFDPDRYFEDDDDEGPFVEVDEPEETGSRRVELQSILARIDHDDDEEDEDFEADDFVIDHNTENEDEDGFELGDDFAGEDGFFFGSDEDSGPIPMTRDDFERHTNPGLEPDTAATTAAKLNFKAMIERAKSAASGLGARRRKQQSPQRRQIVIGVIAAIAVFGVGFALFSGGGDDTSDSGETASTEVAEAPAASDIDETGVEPEYELVRLGADDGVDPLDIAPPTASAAAAVAPQPVGKAVDAKFEKQNIVAHGQATTNEAHTLTRSCVLRKGPASRFAQIKPLNPGEKLTVLTKSSEDWVSMTQGKVSGWAKGCAEGTKCQLRMGPGEHFRYAFSGDDTPRPTSRVVSSPRWSYVQSGDIYGWTGPACFKK